jgi:hypothetical protein
MPLKQVTLISSIGVGAAFAIHLVNCNWWSMIGHPQLILPFVGPALMYGSLLFFLINLYRRG